MTSPPKPELDGDFDDALPDPTPEEVEGLRAARRSIARGDGLTIEQLEARTEAFLRKRAATRRTP